MSAEIIPLDQARSRALVAEERQQYVTMRLNGQLFGLPVLKVRDVLKELKITAIPLAPADIAGALNLRGRIVTVLNMHNRLGLEKKQGKVMLVVVEHDGDLFSLMVDEVGDVMTLSKADFEGNPSNLPAQWVRVSKGVFRLEKELMLVLDIDNLFNQ
jgi:purine-binding chemotaxis protein CheW